MAGARITVRLDDEFSHRLAEEVQATGRTQSDVVREALAAFFRGRPLPVTCLEVARRHQLIGRGKGLPVDLSTHDRHLEGFGAMPAYLTRAARSKGE